MNQEVTYVGSVVNEAISSVNNTLEQFSSLSSEIKSATNQIVSAKGFQQYIGGINSDTFSSVVEECNKALQELVHSIRQKQVKILAYSEDKEEIKKFLNSLSRIDYSKLDLKELDQYISFGTKASNIFKGAVGAVASAGLGLAEGIMDFGETAADLLDLGHTTILSVFALGDQNKLDSMWAETKARVQEKKVENIFNNIYKNTEAGQFIKNNAYGNEIARGIGKGLGYTAGIIGLNVITGGLASGGIGAAGSITAGGLATTAGLLGFANGTEEAWADGATIGKGLATGLATGAWEGAQWYMGAKINQIGGYGDRIAQGIFKGAKSGVGVRIGLDSLTAATDAFVRPGLSLIYKDYGGANIAENYSTAFQMAGGWKNVGTQAAIGAIASAVSEYSGARKLLKEANAQRQRAYDIFSTEGRARLAEEGIALEDAIRVEEEAVQSGNYSKSRFRTIDGGEIKVVDTPFNSRSSNVTRNYRWFMDGAYVPQDVAYRTVDGAFEGVERSISAADAIQLINQHRGSMSGAEYTDLINATKIFQSRGLPVNINSLKLIINHSEGNIGRIGQAVTMGCKGLSEDVVDDVSKELAEKIFNPSGGDPNFLKIIRDDLITDLRAAQQDTWDRSGRLLASLDSEELIRRVRGETTESTIAGIKKYYGPYLTEETVARLAACDGYPATIRKILVQDPNVPIEMLDILSDGGAAKIFKSRNQARFRAISAVKQNDFEAAIRLVGGGDASYFDGHSELLKATHVFESAEQVRRTYYHIIDDFVAGGSTLREATIQARMMEANALNQLGKDATFLFRAMPDEANFTVRDAMYKWNDSVFATVTPVAGSTLPSSQYMRMHYVDQTGLRVDRLITDFQDLMNRRGNEVQQMAMLKQYDPKYSSSATRLFTEAYINAASDMNNPNRREAILFMSKLLELDSQGRPLSVINNAAKTGSQQCGGEINLSTATIDSGSVGVVYHENGHYVFETTLGSRYPAGFENVRQRAVQKLNSSASQRLLSMYSENLDEVEYYASYRADQKLLERLRTRFGPGKFTTIMQYQDALVSKYERMNEGMRQTQLRHDMTYGGTYTTKNFDTDYVHKFDFKNAGDLGRIELKARQAKVQDAIIRQEFGDYATISSVIDSATQGEVRYSYGHGAKYFARNSDKNYLTYHELIADYSSLRLRGQNTAIGFLRKVLGDELFDTIDYTYRTMLK